jgi:hypothetical protein
MRKPPTRTRHPIPLPSLALGLGLVAAACASTGSSKTSQGDGAPERPIAELVESTNTPEPIGQLLARMDLAIQRWNQLQLAGTTKEDREKARKLELWIQGEAHRRRSELTEQLETGPRQNRVVAAMALGFTREAEAQSPLIAALQDQDPEVVNNALLGLWLLQRADTPLDRIAELLRTSQDPTIRNNAALCLAKLTGAGARGDAAIEAARLGLLDSEPSVRSHSAFVLGNLHDKASIEPLKEQLTDTVPIVAAAAAIALKHIAIGVPGEKGKIVRALVAVLDDSKGVVHHEVRVALLELAGKDYGKESEDWLEWALRLP